MALTGAACWLQMSATMQVPAHCTRTLSMASPPRYAAVRAAPLLPTTTLAHPLCAASLLPPPPHPAPQPPSQVLKLPGDDGPYVVLDGAHTEDSAAALAAAVRSVFPAPTPVALLLAMAADKEHRAVVAALRGLQPRVAIFTTVPIAGSYRRAAAPGAVAQWGGRSGWVPPVALVRLHHA